VTAGAAIVVVVIPHSPVVDCPKNKQFPCHQL
jgi:hypothetical protein